ncbi:AAA family ATPase [Actinoplanes solisilvae]|uniref:AAA family ATPase n=1 Tax=Actinoplanes solisilvae TaxID=2486853 RepID=UPI000FDAF889|nr:AAA family ATPase [Actinoplanes solisilvae]
MADALRVHLLGGFRVEVAGRDVPDGEWRRSGATALVKILCLHRRLHRDQAVDLLWPDAAGDVGLRRLNKALHYARRVLGSDRLRQRDGMLLFATDNLWTDVDAFEQAARKGDTEAALALYTGDLLPENRFDDWAEPRRTELRDAVVPLLLARASGGTPQQAERDLLRLIALDPLHEEAYARLMRLEAGRGHRHVALRWYDRLAAQLRAELDVEPRADLQQLHRTLSTGGVVEEQARGTAGVRAGKTARAGAGGQAAELDGSAHGSAPRRAGAPAAARAEERAVTRAEESARTGPSESGGNGPDEERKLVTVLDADLRGVRGTAADADPESARREIARWTDQLGEIVARWGGAVQPLLGGGVIGIFGFPTAREDHAVRALRAASEILRRCPAPIRLSVDTGQIIAPASGAELSRIGGAVLDSAARLRAAAAPHTVLVADRTRRAAEQVEFRAGASSPAAFSPGPANRAALSHGPANPAANGTDDPAGNGSADPAANGSADAAGFRFSDAYSVGAPPVIAYRLLNGEIDRAAPTKSARETPMIGRADELKAVLSLIDEAVTSGRPRLITVTGVAGIGKTRLVHEIVARQENARVLVGRCLAAGDGITFWALGEILRQACGIPLGDSGARAQQRLRDHLREVLEGQRLTPAELDTTIFALATTAAVRLPDNPLDAADPREVADELSRAWPRLATAFATRGPLLLVVEDLHWAGAPLVGMLSRLVTRAHGPIVVLTTARPEFLESQPGRPDVSMVSLRELPPDDSRTLLAALPHPPSRRDEILARAEGNPYFLAQLAAHAKDDDSLPDTLHALLAARVDALPADEKRLLQAASVMGRVFWTPPLRARLGDNLPTILAALEDKSLIHARDDEYAFQHALLRDVAYASLPAAQRAAGHAEVAAWLEEVSRERIDEVIELVAVHYSAAADGPDADEWTRGKAFRSLITAGIAARRRWAVPRALDLHRAAVRHAATPAERAGALEAIGDDHETAYAGDEAVQAWREAITALRNAPEHGDRRAGLCLKTAQMVVARWGGFRAPADPALGDRVIDEGLAAVADPPTKTQLLALRALCGGRWAWTGRDDPVPVTGRQAAADEACALADRLGSPMLRAQALLGLTAVRFLQERYDDAVTTVLDEVALVEQEGRNRDRALGHAIACLVVGGVRGDYELALEHAHRSYDWARDLSPHDRLHGTAAVLVCLEELGRWDEVDPFLDEHLSLRQGPIVGMACPYIRSGPLTGALALARRGDIARAREVAATVSVDLNYPGMAEVVRARLAVVTGDVTTGRALAERVVALGRRPGPEEIPHEALALVEALRAAGDHDALAGFLPHAKKTAAYLAPLRSALTKNRSALDPVERA